MFKDIPAHTQGIYTTSENVVRSLTCNDLEFPTATPPSLGHPTLFPSEDPLVLVSEEGLGTPELTPKRASWLLSGMVLMGLDSYFPRVFAVSSLWAPLQAAMSVLYWMASWWILPPGWEPNLVSLAPSLTGPMVLTALGVTLRSPEAWRSCGLLAWFYNQSSEFP
ncbi:hypothetical protein DSO57_1010024 [Entomophthora muscae]|uniref:Uncharacterized protein n=1 Tax=Entomophthora muscae TaxID=34485 RepID=A0ACC2S8L6_9FUNG|nr:hypothetical protein DSO57_1010024 [Entomophthora muscae]